MSEYNVKLVGAAIIVTSGMQKSITLSVFESETVSEVTCDRTCYILKMCWNELI